jgi:hypothetical protein
MSEAEKTRRETLKLAAAVAAFGTALGFRQTAEASSGSTTPPKDPTPLTTKQLKIDRLELKFYTEDKLVHSCSVPQSAIKMLKQGARLEYKIYRNNQLWDLKS